MPFGGASLQKMGGERTDEGVYYAARFVICLCLSPSDCHDLPLCWTYDAAGAQIFALAIENAK